MPAELHSLTGGQLEVVLIGNILFTTFTVITYMGRIEIRSVLMFKWNDYKYLFVGMEEVAIST